MAADRQPVPFSHKKHAAAACSVCHPTAAAGARAGLPGAAQCMICHQTVASNKPPIRRLARWQASGEPVPWVRLYQVPDYVVFRHATHLAAQIECASCHGPVEQRETLTRETVPNMKFCMDCHRTRKVSNACNLCHELGQ